MEPPPEGLDTLSKRCIDTFSKPPSILASGFEKCLDNPYNPKPKKGEKGGPEGIINMGTAQNLLVNELVVDELEKFDNIKTDETRYFPDNGLKAFREALADFLTGHTPADPNYPNDHQKIEFDEVSVTNGCSSAFCALAYLLGNEGDYFLFPTPSYGMVKEYMGNYMGLQARPVNMEENDFTLSVELLKKAFDEFEKEKDQDSIPAHKKIRALVMVNPNNPTGNTIDRDTMLDILEFAKEKELHVVIDEIYFLSTFDIKSYVGSLSYNGVWPDPERTHFMWGFSKDFAMSGLRCAVIYSRNKALHEAFGKDIAAFHMVSGTVQMRLAHMLRDKNFIDFFLPESRIRLKKNADKVVETLNHLQMKCLEPKGTLYLWADFSRLVKPGDDDDENFDKAKKIYDDMLNMKGGGICIPFSAGFLGKNPCWFRIVFAIQSDYLDKAMERLKSFVEQHAEDSVELEEDQEDVPAEHLNALWHEEHRRFH